MVTLGMAQASISTAARSHLLHASRDTRTSLYIAQTGGDRFGRIRGLLLQAGVRESALDNGYGRTQNEQKLFRVLPWIPGLLFNMHWPPTPA